MENEKALLKVVSRYLMQHNKNALLSALSNCVTTPKLKKYVKVSVFIFLFAP